jgi:general transcription factor 3C polypeptide 1
MDSVVHAALEEICSKGEKGITLPNLWPKLESTLSSNGLHICTNVKKAIWINLLNIPGLQFKSKDVYYEAQHSSIQFVENCDEMKLTVVAAENLRNSFIGIYDIQASDTAISLPQRHSLERLAIARTNGITQSELSKELDIKGKNFFYVVKKLESAGLVVKQSTILRKKSSKEDSSVATSIIATNMLYLYRYAKHLGCQQRMEVTMEDKNSNGDKDSDVAEEYAKEDVVVKDFLPSLKAVCDKLEQADGKVLVVSDIKKELGYQGNRAHKAWRDICNRLKEACVVEEFPAEVTNKKVDCLRLLKKFSPKHFEQKVSGWQPDDLNTEQPVKLRKRGDITEQLVELPIERQIYDMIDAEGSKGLLITEVFDRLGITNKKFYDRMLMTFTRFGMQLQAESLNKGAAYRVWTSGNSPSEASSKPEIPSIENNKSIQTVDDRPPECSTSDKGPTADVAVIPAISNIESNDMLICQSTSQDSPPLEPSNIPAPNTDLQIVEKSTSKSNRRSYPRYPCLSLSASSMQREQRILDLLKDEKFLIRADLHRKIENLDKDKTTTLDRKTLERSLNKLQEKGLCKCIRVSVPVVSSCARSRTSDVVLNQKYKDVSPSLLSQIHDRLRAFDVETRSQGYHRPKKYKTKTLPVLDDVERSSNNVKCSQTERAEAMRANGFILAKMVRLKLLHIYLWGFLNSLPGWDDSMSSGKHGYDQSNPHSTCKPFDLDTAIKSLPLELFLQVVGSTLKFEDMVEKCKQKLRLSDLLATEYRLLMDTQATGRISYLVDILRRLKLMRTVSVETSEEVSDARHTTLTYALELKPYIEEPSVTMVVPASSGFDFRPHIRHDFVLSSKEAVDDYWNTLEYCYAAADSKAALHAFPGSAVHEVFLFRSWVSVRVMTAEQRAQLLERIVNEDSNRKLSFQECEAIAKDLNLTLEQVLRVYYDKRQKRISKGVEDYHLLKKNSSRKRKRRPSRRKPLKDGSLDGESSEQTRDKMSDSDEQLTEEQTPLSPSKRNHHMETIEELYSNEEEEDEEKKEDDEDGDTFISKVVPKLNPPRGKKFSWTEEADRQLLMKYVRTRAALGANIHRVDWRSLQDLPAHPNSCKRRMAAMKSSSKPFRKSLMKLLNLLTERYSKYLDKYQNKGSQRNVMVRKPPAVESSSQQNSDELDGESVWDDFNDEKVKLALDEVLLNKRMAKGGCVYDDDEYSVLNSSVEGRDPLGRKVGSSGLNSSLGTVKVSGKRLGCHRIPRKYIKLINEGSTVSRRAYESLAVSNAIELFKLVFLSTSKAPEVPNLLAETLRRYSEHDLFAAFHYLRENKTMVGGKGNSPFVLSQDFLTRISASPFPSDTGERASKFENWVREREKELMGNGIDLYADLQCGDLVHLFGKVSSGELEIHPLLPDEGVGEAEDSRPSKRKSDDSKEVSNKSKKSKPSPVTGEGGEVISRKEKGFPGIKISLSSAAISKDELVEFGKNIDSHAESYPFCKNDQASSTVSSDCMLLDHAEELLHTAPSNIGDSELRHAKELLHTAPSNIGDGELQWEAMVEYAKHVLNCTFEQQLFRTVHSAIQKAGDQGLSVQEISELINIQGEKMPEHIVEVLEAFGCALKVNGYASVRFVDSLYRSKYFLMPLTGRKQDHKVNRLSDRVISRGNEHIIPQLENKESGVIETADMMKSHDESHRVTILNLPPDEIAAQPTNESQIQIQRQTENQRCVKASTSKVCSGNSNLPRPILPWINGDGTVNVVVYKGHVRCILGIIMQNPGILEDGILKQICTSHQASILNPQSCRNLLELMILDKHIFVRKMIQSVPGEPPGLLGGLLGNSFKKSKMTFREHFFANPMSSTFL